MANNEDANTIVTIRSRAVEVSASQVWEVLSEFESISRWAENVDHSCLLTHDPVGLGTVRRIQAGPLTVTEEVTMWEPDRKLSYRIDGLPPIVTKVTNTWTLVEQGGTSPSVEVTLTTRITPGPKPPQKLAAKVLARKLAQASDQMLEGIAVACEGHDVGSSEHKIVGGQS